MAADTHAYPAASWPDASRRMTGVLLDPAATFHAIKIEPHWLPSLTCFTIATFVQTAVALPLSLERVNRQIQAMNPNIQPDALLQSAEIPRFVLASASLLASFITPLAIVLITAGLVHVLAILMRGSMATEGRTVFAACAHASVVLALALLARTALVYTRQTMNVSLGADMLFPDSTRSHATAMLMQFADVFRVWFAVVLAIAVRVLYDVAVWKAAVVSLGVNLFWFLVFVLLFGTWML